MALQDILQKIRSDGEADVQAIQTARDTELATIASNHTKAVAERTAVATEDTKRRVEKVTERILAKARHKAQFIAGNAEQAKLEAVFSAIKNELNNLDETAYTAFLTKQFSSLKSIKEGSFLVAKERSAATTTFLIAQGVAADAITVETDNVLLGGFVFVTAKQDFDCSFRGFVQNIRDNHTVEIAHKLTN